MAEPSAIIGQKIQNNAACVDWTHDLSIFSATLSYILVSMKTHLNVKFNLPNWAKPAGLCQISLIQSSITLVPLWHYIPPPYLPHAHTLPSYPLIEFPQQSVAANSLGVRFFSL